MSEINLISQGIEQFGKLAGKSLDTVKEVIGIRENSDVSRMNARAESRAKMISAGKNTIPIAVVAIIAIVFLIVILNKK